MPLDFLFKEPSIDHKATRQAVKNFFKQQYPRLKTLSSMDLQGVNYDSPKIKTSRTNNAEERTIRIVQSKHYLSLIEQCINGLDEIDKKIFTSLAIKHLSGLQVQELTGYGQSQLYTRYGRACEQIAENLALISDIDLMRYERN